MFVVICYDTPDDRRRRKLAQLLEGHGERVQDSVFEIHVDARRLRTLQTRIATLVNHEEDRVCYYSLCAKDLRDIRHDGTGSEPVNTVDRIF